MEAFALALLSAALVEVAASRACIVIDRTGPQGYVDRSGSNIVRATRIYSAVDYRDE